MLAEKTITSINTSLEQDQEVSFRKHLGVSVLGHSCSRHLWYHFRWAKRETFTGQQLRLFNRGHMEEKRFVGWLKGIGYKVKDTNKKGEQFRVKAFNGHLGGSLDARIKGVLEVPKGEVCLGEFKTHGDKYFKYFLTKKLKEAFFTHYMQMQVYMLLAGLKYGLYMAINKNTDDIYCEIIFFEEDLAKLYLDRGERIIKAIEAPKRVSTKASFYKCRWCIYQDICHYDEAAEINCRTCAFSSPSQNKTWYCNLLNVYLSNNFLTLLRDCPQHIYLPDMIGSAKVLEIDDKRRYIKLRYKDHEFYHGNYVGYINSKSIYNWRQ